jgi:hypothetical protein
VREKHEIQTRGGRQTDIRPEYDFGKMKGGIRGKYYQAYRKGTNLVRLAPDVAKAFPDDDSVNKALRVLLRASKTALSRSNRAGIRARSTTN